MEKKHSLDSHHQRNRFDICDYQVHPNDALIKVYEHDSIEKKEDKAKGVVEERGKEANVYWSPLIRISEEYIINPEGRINVWHINTSL